MRYAGAVASMGLIALLDCEGPLHPNDPGIPDALCRSRCEREHACDGSIDVGGCVGNCEHGLSPRVVYDREDLVASKRNCALGQPCVANVDRAISSCENDVWRRLEPSAVDRAYCVRRVARAFKCGDYRWDEEHCLDSTKGYTDVIVGQLGDCLDQPCTKYRGCELAVVGYDQVWADRDRIAAFYGNPIPKAGPPTVTLHGRVVAEGGGPIADAEVCVLDRRSCTRSDASGGFALAVAAHAELALAIVAPAFVRRLVAVATTGHDVDTLGVDLLPDAVVRARYVAMGAAYPDEARGFIYATARPLSGDATGLAGVAITIAPSSGVGPSFLSAAGDVDPTLHETSTDSSALFAAVAPGEVTLTMGTTGAACVPNYGGWPSGVGSVRVPVAAGYETRVSMRCPK
jgi:hypothetical protein